MITWDQFYANELPPEDRRDWTMKTLALLRRELVAGGNLLTGYLKWGLPFVQDVAALAHFEEARRGEGLGDQAASAAASGALTLVDWDSVERLVSDGAEDYKRYLDKTGESEDLQPYLDGMEYGLKDRLPGVSAPGDVFRALTGVPYS